jgi:hypothetical protein
MYDGLRRLGVVRMETISRKLRMAVGIANKPLTIQTRIPVVWSKYEGFLL